MTSLRRRLHHGDVDGRKYEHVERDQSDYLNEPLLGSYKDDYSEKKKYGGEDDTWDDDKKKADLHWSSLFSNLISQWAQWLAQIVLGSGSVIGRLLPIPFINAGKEARFEVSLSPLQEERLRTLQQRLEVPFDSSILEHQDALKQLWRLSYPGREFPPPKSELWKEMGWQGTDPSTDFRGGGYISLENLIFFAKEYPESFQRLLHKTEGTRADWEYPFAVAGVNISFTLVQMLNLHSGKPSSIVSSNFMTLLAEDEMAFDNLFCVAFELMDAQWLAKRASYMEFNDVLKATRQQLERELSLEDVHTIKDLPAYTLLNR